MKKHLPLLLFLLAPLSAESIDDYQRWIDEDVRYIISRSEKEEFKRLTDDAQRAVFVEEFWRKRDPDAATEANPFKAEHYRRLEYANKHFSSGKPGWRTDRGRLYIIHGEPDQRLVFPGEELRRKKELGIGEGDTVATSSFAYGDVTISIPDAELWTYYDVSRGTLRGQTDVLLMRISLSDAQQLLVMRNPQSNRFIDRNQFYGSGLYRGSGQGGQDFHIVYAGTPRFNSNVDFYRALEESPNSFEAFEMTQSAAEMLRSPGDLLERELQRKRQVRQEVQSAIFFDEIPARLGYWFLHAGDGYTYVPMALHVPGDAVGESRQLTIVVEARRQGQLIAEVVDEIDFSDALPTRLLYEGVTYQTRLAVQPGRHVVDAYLLDRAGGRYRHLQQTIDVPALTPGAFILSDPILCRAVRTVEKKSKGVQLTGFQQQRDWFTLSPANPLRVDDYLLVPSADRKFRRKDQLTLFMEVYSPSLRGDRPNVELELQLFRGNQAITAPGVKQLEHLTEADLTKLSYGLTLSLARVKRGNYRLVISARDRISGEESVRELEFEVI